MRNASVSFCVIPTHSRSKDRPLQRARGTRYHLGVMSLQKTMIGEFAWDDAYRVSDFHDVMTPALLVYPEFIASNIERTVALLNGDASRWRVHIKTAKLAYTL